jgi:hypothetical protein
MARDDAVKSCDIITITPAVLYHAALSFLSLSLSLSLSLTHILALLQNFLDTAAAAAAHAYNTNLIHKHINNERVFS